MSERTWCGPGPRQCQVREEMSESGIEITQLAKDWWMGDDDIDISIVSYCPWCGLPLDDPKEVPDVG